MTVHVKLFDKNTESIVFLNCLEYGFTGGRLEITDRDGNTLGSFSERDISSWWVEGKSDQPQSFD
jgi:hypothetical protein